MSDFLAEKVPPMPPLKSSDIELIAERFLEKVYPDALRHPTQLPFEDLVDTILQEHGICVRPASFEEMGERAGATDPSPGSCINILVREDVWNALFRGGRSAHYAKTTIAHELGHAILHVPTMRRRMSLPIQSGTLNRVQRSELKPYVDPEWQAWAFAGAIIAPRSTLTTLHCGSVAQVAEIYGVSEVMMRKRISRAQLLRRFGMA